MKARTSAVTRRAARDSLPPPARASLLLPLSWLPPRASLLLSRLLTCACLLPPLPRASLLLPSLSLLSWLTWPSWLSWLSWLLQRVPDPLRPAPRLLGLLFLAALPGLRTSVLLSRELSLLRECDASNTPA